MSVSRFFLLLLLLARGDHAGKWAASTQGTVRRLDTMEALELPCTTTVRDSAAKLSSADRAVHAAAFTVSPSVVAAAWGSPLRLRYFAHDVLFAANPDTRDPKKWSPSYQALRPEFETMTLARIDARDAQRALGRLIVHDRNSETIDPGQADARLALLFAALVDSSAPMDLLWAHWDNQDDTNFDGVVAVIRATGEVRVLMTNDFA